MTTARDRLLAWLSRPVCASGLATYRVLFGLLLFAGIVRFMASGWIDRFYGEPTFFFKYWGFEWVQPLPVGGMYVLYGALAACALALAAGFHHRKAALLFAVGFTYAELIDVTNYLNHYYLVSLVALLFVFLPAERGRAVVPAWAVHLLRVQVGVVYVYAGLAKLQPDWLLGAQPLNIWLTARVDTPLIGAWLAEPWVHLAASWAAFLFDTTIVLWLSWRRTRLVAYVALVGFHAMTGVFFNIGMFPFIMTLSALVFFPPDWPRRLARRAPAVPAARELAASPHRRLGLSVAGAFVAFQVLFPLRHHLYGGDVLWHEQGMRWSWKVMVREKHGSVTYHLTFPSSGKRLQVPPGRYLDARQEREMAGQPDLILQLAHHIARDYRARGHHDVEVRAEALVSLNGRPSRPLIDPTVDLARVPDNLAPAAWITDAPADPPIHLSPRRLATR